MAQKIIFDKIHEKFVVICVAPQANILFNVNARKLSVNPDFVPT